MAGGHCCEICGENSGRYSCPRCRLSFCSVSCYQSEKHSDCSEIFYEKLVKEELKNCSSDPEAKKRMLDILRQGQDTEGSLDSDDDEESTTDLASRLLNVNLDDEGAVWEKLMPEEKHKFRKLIASGNILQLLPEWEPWWKTKKRITLIQDYDVSFDWKSLCPAVPSEIPELSKMTKTKPSPCLPFMLLNVLKSYVFTVRWFKGAHKDLPVESISTCIALSATLRTNEVFRCPTEALMGFECDLSKCNWVRCSRYDKNILLEDLMDIIKGSDCDDLFFCLKAALSDLGSLCSCAIAVLESSSSCHLKRFSGPPPKIRHLRQISMRMSYLLSWSNNHGMSLINALHHLT